jgi:hypothetical protein
MKPSKAKAKEGMKRRDWQVARAKLLSLVMDLSTVPQEKHSQEQRNAFTDAWKGCALTAEDYIMELEKRLMSA